MRKLIHVLLLALACQTVAALPDIEDDEVEDDIFGPGDDYPGPTCEWCEYNEDDLMDFVAYAYNGFFGDDPFLPEMNYGIPFRVYTPDRQWVVVWFEDVVFDVPTLLPNLMKVVIRKVDGQVIKIEVVQGAPDMPYTNPPPPPDPDSCTCSEGGGGEADDENSNYENDEEMDEIETDEYVGVVEIEDPDEDGEFDDWEEEL